MRRRLVLAALVTLCILPLPLKASQENSVEMRVKKVTLDPYSKSPVVILEGGQEKQLIPIWIGASEARAIAMELESVTSPRPMTHDLIRNILQGLGATLYRITITDLRNNTYFAMITVKLKGQEVQIDSRPSDAIALALKMKAPIYASSQVLSKARQLPSPETPREQMRKIHGMQLQNLTGELASLFDLQFTKGVLVADVELGSVGSEAGIQRGDVILRVNDQGVSQVSDLERAIRGAKRRSQMRIQLWRKGKNMTLVMQLPAGS